MLISLLRSYLAPYRRLLFVVVILSAGRDHGLPLPAEPERVDHRRRAWLRAIPEFIWSTGKAMLTVSRCR